MILCSVETEEYIRRFAHVTTTYQRNSLQAADLTVLPETLRSVFTELEAVVKRQLADETTAISDLDVCAEFAWTHHCEDQLFWIFDALIEHLPLNESLVGKWLDRHPLLVFCVLVCVELQVACRDEPRLIGGRLQDLDPA